MGGEAWIIGAQHSCQGPGRGEAGGSEKQTGQGGGRRWPAAGCEGRERGFRMLEMPANMFSPQVSRRTQPLPMS